VQPLAQRSVRPWVLQSLRTHASQMHPGLTSCARHALLFVDTQQDTRTCSLHHLLPRSLHSYHRGPYSPSSSVSQRCNDVPSELPLALQLALQSAQRWEHQWEQQ
jgi:hypothetical protein